MKRRLVTSAFSIAAMFVTSSCKDDPKKNHPDEETAVLADATEEIANSSAFFKASWGKAFVVKFADLPASAETENAPYSGSWFPEAAGGTGVFPNNGSGSALQKYDQAFYGGVSRALLWEQRNHSGTGTSWAGHCNGFGASSARHAEPVNSVIRNGVKFDPIHIKAMMAEIYMSANYFFLGGKRCEVQSDQAPNPDYERRYAHIMGECEDVNPGTFHVAVTNWIGKLKKPLVIDISRNDAVWNYPFYKYDSSSTTVTSVEALQIIGSRKSTYEFNPSATKFEHVRMTLTYASAFVDEIAPAGISPVAMPLDYILEINPEGQIIGGEWSQASRSKHPDFVWAPMEPMQGADHKSFGNPYLDVSEVLEIWAESAGYGSMANAPVQLSGESWTSSWGIYEGFEVSVDGGSRGAVFLNEIGNKMNITRKTGFPAISLEVNGEVIAQESEDKLTQKFKIEPVEGINWASFTYNPGSGPKSHVTLFHVTR